ncbi:glycosyltransferase family 4 protein [Frigoribacterium sp. Leaf164]|uniref:glycosyltransferase family 4 protein n=1 Tax=Frigoribacterium sp. Leaf164 TaxID=1736282 RepID=UPI0009EB3E79|nr:glycosyltransferase family 4 protein [Frigoribacterium sp. Leaf164]
MCNITGGGVPTTCRLRRKAVVRVVYLHQYFLTPAQAGGVRSFHVATALARRGHDVHVVTATPPVDAAPASAHGADADEVHDGVTVHRLPVDYAAAMGDGRRIVAFVAFALRSSLLARSLRGDVVVATSTPLTIAVPGIAATLLRRAPLVFEVRDSWPEVPIAMGALRHPLLRAAARLLERAAYASSSTVVALSPGMADSVVRAGHPRDRTVVVPNMSDLERFDPARARPEAFTGRHPRLLGRRLAVYCGTFGRANGLDHLVDVAVELDRRGHDLVVVLLGAGAEKEAVRERARRLGVLDRSLVVLDAVAKADLPDVLAASTVALSSFADVPALRANSANKYFDALAAARPVAVNVGGWQAEALVETGAGLQLDRDPARAARALADFVDDAAGLRQAGRAARRLAEERYAQPLLVARLCDVVECDAAAAASPPGRSRGRSARRD